jgi:2-dehydro-3-deoxyphosphogluconate aldolase/(4S)-4-hydroxy-2-oxoglutarate aldolase
MSVLDRLRQERIVAILRRVDDIDAAVERVRAAGISLVEITLDSTGALEALGRHPGCLAGTVRTAADVDAAHKAGAVGVVGPSFSTPVARRAFELGLPYLPGAFTPTEVETAWRAGAELVKLFPAALGGPDYIRHLHGPLADVPLIATGGIDAGNARAFLDAGAVAVGVGTSLLRPGEAERVVEAVRGS